MHTVYTANSHYGGTCVCLSVKCCYPSSSPQEGAYLYGIYLVLVSANTLNERLLPQMMALQQLSQLFLESKHTNSCRGLTKAVREKDLKLEGVQLDELKKVIVRHWAFHFRSYRSRTDVFLSMLLCFPCISWLMYFVILSHIKGSGDWTLASVINLG